MTAPRRPGGPGAGPPRARPPPREVISPIAGVPVPSADHPGRPAVYGHPAFPPGRSRLAHQRSRHHGHRRPHVHPAILCRAATPETASRYAFTATCDTDLDNLDTGQEGLDIVVDPRPGRPGADLPRAQRSAAPGSRQPPASPAALGRHEHEMGRTAHHRRRRHGLRHDNRLLRLRPRLRGPRPAGAAHRHPGHRRPGAPPPPRPPPCPWPTRRRARRRPCRRRP